MGLFDKKFCDVCGEKIGLLGNRKLEDGNLCKDCAGKLSPWFDDRRHSTLESIKSQLASREANKEKANAFSMTKFFGDGSKVIMIDENKGTFAVAPKKDMPGGNPDIIDISAITSFNLDTEEHKKEITYKDNTGAIKSYNPKQFEYSYDFYYEIHVNHPYIDEIRFQLNSMRVELREATKGEKISSVLGVLSGQNSTVVTQNPQYDKYMTMGQDISECLKAKRNAAPDVSAAPVSLAESASSRCGYVVSGTMAISSSDPEIGVFQYTCDGTSADLTLEANMEIYVMQFGKATVADVKGIVRKTVNIFLEAMLQNNTPADKLDSYTMNLPIMASTGMAPELALIGLRCTSFTVNSFKVNNIRNGGTAGTAAAQPVSTAWVCGYCGSKNEGGNFCQNCGGKKD